MAINYATKNTAAVPQKVVSPEEVRQKAEEAFAPNPGVALAVTVPWLDTATSNAHFQNWGNEFSLTGLDIAMTLRQEVYFANDLSKCAIGMWAQHENQHVQDNIALLQRMPVEIPKDISLKPILVDGQRFPAEHAQLVGETIVDLIGMLWVRLTAEALKQRDTEQEYARVHRQVLRGCPGPFYHIVEKGDTLSKISLFYYGDSVQYDVIYKRNRAVIGPNKNLIVPRQRLEIPKP